MTAILAGLGSFRRFVTRRPGPESGRSDRSNAIRLIAGLHCIGSDHRLISVIPIAKDTCSQTQPVYIMQHECGKSSRRVKKGGLVDYSGLCHRGLMDARRNGRPMISAADEVLMRGSAICRSMSRINHDV